MSRKTYFYSATFLSAFLLFQIQPMVSKALLPVFGGSYMVWGVCMLFFQAVVLAGYFYSHAIHKMLGVGRYARFHLLLLLIPLLIARFRLDVAAQHQEGVSLAWSVVLMLTCLVGAPVFVLSTTSLMLQKWLSASDVAGKENPYVLYSASNLGSMLGLLTYPLVVEPLLPLEQQWKIWLLSYAVLALLHVPCLPRGGNAREGEANEESGTPATAGQKTKWFVLSATACAMLLAVTNVLTLDVASVPFLWVLPLSVYLLSFVVTFKRNAWYPAWSRQALIWALAVGVILCLLSQIRLTVPIVALVLVHMGILFAACLCCNGELTAIKPARASELTTFYVLIALGGLAGTAVVSWLIPMVSKSLIEYPLALGATAIAMALCAANSQEKGGTLKTVLLMGGIVVCFTVVPFVMVRSNLTPGSKGAVILLATIGMPALFIMRYASMNSRQFAVVLFAAVLSVGLVEDFALGGFNVARIRNFYGIYKVYEKGNIRYLKHGTTLHGRQYLSGPKRDTPLSYFHPTTPAAGVLTSQDMAFKNMAMIGLGSGALAAYAHEGQTFTILELDRDNLVVAEKYFSYLEIGRKNGARIAFEVGDGRILVRKMGQASLDLLIVDAFNSGSIPVHLLTVEAFKEYFSALGDNGLLLMHVSNRMMDLPPVVYANGKELGLLVCENSNAGYADPDANDTVWMAVSKNSGTIEIMKQKLGWWERDSGGKLPKPWTDQYCNIFGAMMRM